MGRPHPPAQPRRLHAEGRRQLLTGPFDNSAAAALVRQELPRRARWELIDLTLDWRFLHDPDDWMLADQDVRGGSPDPAWHDLQIFGHLSFANGGGATPVVGIRLCDGAICGLDVESYEDLRPYSSTLAVFCRTFTILDRALTGRP